MLTIISAVTANSFNHFSVVFTLITNADLENPEGQECPNLLDPSDMPDLEEQATSSDEEGKEPSFTRNPVTRKKNQVGRSNTSTSPTPVATQTGNERTPPTSPVPTAAQDANPRSTLPS